jgi:putative endonuclease
MFFIYVLNSLSRKYIYVGMTDNVVRRFRQHQKGKEKTTAPYRPFEILFTEKYNTRSEAREREKFLKSGCGKEWIKESFQRNK